MQLPAALARGLARVEDGVLATLGLGLLVMAAAQLLFRVVGGGPQWLDPLMRSTTFWLALAGALVATREGRQLHIDALSARLSGLLGRAARVLVALFTASVCALLAHAGWTLAVLEREGGSEAFAGIPSWWLLAALPVVFALMALHALVHVLRPPRPHHEGERAEPSA